MTEVKRSKRRGRIAALVAVLAASTLDNAESFFFPSGARCFTTTGGAPNASTLTPGGVVGGDTRYGAKETLAMRAGRRGFLCGRQRSISSARGSVVSGSAGRQGRGREGGSRLFANGDVRFGIAHGKHRRPRWNESSERDAIPRSRSMTAFATSASAAISGSPEGSVRGGSSGERWEKEKDSVPSAGDLLVKGRDLFNEKFGQPQDTSHICAGYAPGRVNLIGEHTDYNGGFVMPLALERGTVVYGVGRLVDSSDVDNLEPGKGWCRVLSETMQQQEAEGEGGEGDCSEVRFKADESLSPGQPEWANYVKGVVKEYMIKIPEGKTLDLTATVVGVVPIGGGVSSSASLSVAMATFVEGILSTAGITPPSSKEKAHLCRMAEHNFLNMPCGIMDQFVTSMAVSGHAMLLDCRSEEPDAVPLCDPNVVIVVTNSNVKHKLAGSQYPVRVGQCATARDEVQKRHPDVELLRDASPEQVDELDGQVEDAVFRRARHVVSENARTVAAAEALMKGDYRTAGGLMVESHNSLREDYEVSCPEIDTLVNLAMEVKGVYGSRLTGGGFGGCTVTLVEKGSVEELVRHLEEGYSRDMGRDCTIFVTKPGFGARGLTGEKAATDTAWPEGS